MDEAEKTNNCERGMLDNISPESLDLASQLVNFNTPSLLYSSYTILETIRAILLENLECIEI